MKASAKNLKACWESNGLRVRPGVSISEMEAFEAQYGVALTGELRDYFQTVDGMEDEESDSEFLEFYPLRSVKSVTEELIYFGGIPDYREIKTSLPEPEQCFIIIDYMVRSHVYAVHSSTAPTNTAPVIWICGASWRTIAPSFTDFTEKYLADRTEVLFPKDVVE